MKETPRRTISVTSSLNEISMDQTGTSTEEKKEGFFCPLSWSIHHNFAGDDYIESTTVAVSKQDFKAWKQKLYPLSWYIQCYLIIKFWTF
jgi:hypothetical protein